MQARRFAALLILPPAGLFVFFFLGPLLYLFWGSFHEPSSSQLFGDQLTLDNYVKVVADPFYLGIIRRTLSAGLAILGLSLLIGYPVGVLLARASPRGRLIWTVLLLFPLMVSNVVRAYGWLALLGRRGVVNSTLREAGIIDAPLSLLFTFETVVLGLLTFFLPYMIISVANALAAIDKSYGEAAQALGADPWRRFVFVTFPLSSPGVASGCLLVFLLSLSAYVTVTVLGGPRMKMLVSLVFDSVAAFQWPAASALAFIMLAMALAVSAVILAVLRPGRVQGRG